MLYFTLTLQRHKVLSSYHARSQEKYIADFLPVPTSYKLPPAPCILIPEIELPARQFKELHVG